MISRQKEQMALLPRMVRSLLPDFCFAPRVSSQSGHKSIVLPDHLDEVTLCTTTYFATKLLTVSREVILKPILLEYEACRPASLQVLGVF